jgi:MFS family permease
MSSYLTVYLVALHSPVTAIGLAIGISGLLQAALLPAVGWFSRVIGRKSVIQIGDVLGWVVAIGLWIADVSVLWLLIALVLNQLSNVVTPAWNGLFSEDITIQQRSHGYLILQILTILGGLAIPVAAIWEREMGMAHSGRLVLIIAMPMLATSIAVRQWLLHESSGEKAEQSARRSGTWQKTWPRIRPALHSQGIPLAILRILAQFSFSLFITFAPLTFVNRLGLKMHTDQLAFLPLAASIFGLLLWIYHRRLAAVNPYTSLGLSIAALLLGFALLGCGAPGGFAMVLLAWGLVMSGQSVFWSSHTTYWLSWVPDLARVDIQGYVGAVGALLVSIGDPLLAAWVVRHPFFFYWGNFGLSVIMGLLWYSISHWEEPSSNSRTQTS